MADPKATPAAAAPAATKHPVLTAVFGTFAALCVGGAVLAMFAGNESWFVHAYGVVLRLVTGAIALGALGYCLYRGITEMHHHGGHGHHDGYDDKLATRISRRVYDDLTSEGVSAEVATEVALVAAEGGEREALAAAAKAGGADKAPEQNRAAAVALSTRRRVCAAAGHDDEHGDHHGGWLSRNRWWLGAAASFVICLSVAIMPTGGDNAAQTASADSVLEKRIAQLEAGSVAAPATIVQVLSVSAGQTLRIAPPAGYVFEQLPSCPSGATLALSGGMKPWSATCGKDREITLPNDWESGDLTVTAGAEPISLRVKFKPAAS